MLNRITFTGADDQTNPLDLVKMSKLNPMIEWGILFSVTKMGEARYPSSTWLPDLYKVAGSLHLAAHFCGVMARDTLDGNDKWLVGKERFQRVQLNGYDKMNPTFLEMVGRHSSKEFILQTRNKVHLEDTAKAVRECGLENFSLLYDPSGGTGKEADSWPLDPYGVYTGFAGGIKPTSVRKTLEALEGTGRTYWIDMESGIRSKEEFDLGLVGKVLDETKKVLAKK